MGLPAYPALVVVGALGLFTLLAGAARMIPAGRRRTAALLGIAAAPIVAIELGGILTELPFAAAWLGLAFSLAHWPRRWALWSAGGCAIGALALRYAGGIALALLPAWTLACALDLRRARQLRAALACCLAAGCAAAGLLAWNIVRSGHASGAGRGAPDGLRGLLPHAADFGWSAPSALLAGGIRDAIGPHSVAGIAAGLLLFFGLAAGCGWFWCKPVSAFTRPLALTTLGYAVGMVALRCVGNFDLLYNARTFLPILAPALLLFAERPEWRPAFVSVLCGGIVVSGMVSAARGISGQIAADIRPAVAPVRARIAPGDEIALNDDAFSMSAYVAQRTFRIFAAYLRSDPAARFLVLAGRPQDRAGHIAPVDPAWSEYAERLTASQRYQYLVRERHLLVLERRTVSRPTALP
jgi:hypothetical protein